MAKKNSVFICGNCTYQTAQWIGKCPECEEWNTFEEQFQGKTFTNNHTANKQQERERPKLLNEIDINQEIRTSTGINEFDRVLGGGLVKGSLILVGGEPGIGKSTLLTKVLGNLSQKDVENRVLYVSGEESTSQIASRMRRLGIENNKNMFIYHEKDLENIFAEIKTIKPRFLVIDSIQTTLSPELQSAPGTISQVREVTFEIMNLSKVTSNTSFIIGHITKEGAIAGPKILEHMVDTVIYFEGDQNGYYRLLRGIKNRFGDSNEVGIFEMTGAGLMEVSNPSEYFLDDHENEGHGRCTTCILEGTRPLFVEIQALVVENKFGNSRRTTQGFDNNRLSMLIAVIEKYFGISLSFFDVYVNVAGGMKLFSRESDLCIIAAVLSSYFNKSLDSRTVWIGEVGLTGEIRSTPKMDIRLRSMQQLSYKKLITSKKNLDSKEVLINHLMVNNISELKNIFD